MEEIKDIVKREVFVMKEGDHKHVYAEWDNLTAANYCIICGKREDTDD